MAKMQRLAKTTVKAFIPSNQDQKPEVCAAKAFAGKSVQTNEKRIFNIK